MRTIAGTAPPKTNYKVLKCTFLVFFSELFIPLLSISLTQRPLKRRDLQVKRITLAESTKTKTKTRNKCEYNTVGGFLLPRRQSGGNVYW